MGLVLKGERPDAAVASQKGRPQRRILRRVLQIPQQRAHVIEKIAKTTVIEVEHLHATVGKLTVHEDEVRMDDPELRGVVAEAVKHRPHLGLCLGKESGIVWRSEPSDLARLVGGDRGEETIGIPAGQVKVWRRGKVLRVQVHPPQHCTQLVYGAGAEVSIKTAYGAVQPGQHITMEWGINTVTGEDGDQLPRPRADRLRDSQARITP